MKYVVAIGCSFVQGSGVELTKEEAPALVANKLGINQASEQHDVDEDITSQSGPDGAPIPDKLYFNRGRAGACNKFIRRKTMNWVSCNQDKWEDLIVLVGWSSPFRHELFIGGWSYDNPIPYVDRTGGYRQLNSPNITGELAQFIDEDENINNDFFRHYIVHHYDFDEQIRVFLDEIIILQSFLKVNNIKYIFWNSLDYKKRWEKNVYGHKNEKTSLYKNSLIDTNHWIGNSIEYSWEKFLDEVDEEQGLTTRMAKGKGDDHPNQLGHKLWADKIYKKMEKLYGKEL